MNLILELARGMLRRRRRQTLVSVSGVALGVAFFIAIAALMRGFQTYFVSQIIDVAPHITLKDETRTPLAARRGAAHEGRRLVPDRHPDGGPVARLRAADGEPGSAEPPHVVNQILVRLADVTRAEPLARQIEARFGDRSESWEEQNQNILTVFVIQNAIMYSVTGAILLVAAFGIYNIISTVVFEKTRDIAILKSLGFTERDIQLLFLVQGMIACLLGAIAGCLLGALMVEALAQVRFDVSTPAGNDRFILARDWRVYLAASLFAVLAAGVAAVIPARRASRLDPVQVVRGAA
ncbi:MAG TPA: FtsX-like permease family protein [Falsiroseomonas sp.]|jgi:ABC-type lipoprotein release transport system permease subunit|nr:FtsX-like permease family protein [Falsiroseomonas sp.]